MKLPEFCVVIIVMIIFLGFMGLPIGLNGMIRNYGVSINETTGELINADVENSSYFLDIFGGVNGILIILAGAGAVIVGLFARGYDTSLIILPLVITTATLFAGTSWTIISYVSKLNQVWATNVITILFIGIGVAFIWSCVSYFAGR